MINQNTIGQMRYGQMIFGQTIFGQTIFGQTRTVQCIYLEYMNLQKLVLGTSIYKGHLKFKKNVLNRD